MDTDMMIISEGAVVAVILAAGRGHRLGNLTQYRPKCLLPIFADKSVIDFQLTALLQHSSIKRIVIVVGYLGESLQRYVSDRYSNVHIDFVCLEDFMSVNTAQSLAVALEHTGYQHPVLQINGDVLFDPGVLTLLFKQPYGSYMCINETKCDDEAMKALCRSNCIVSVSKLNDPDEAMGEAFGVNFFCSASLSSLYTGLRAAVKNNPQAYFEDGINLMIREQNLYQYKPLSVGNYQAIEIDFPDDLTNARKIANKLAASYGFA